MFGCSLWLRDLRVPKEEGYDNRDKGHTKKAAKMVRVVRAKTLKEQHRLDREGCVLFAMVVGGDYNVNGLERCGPETALKAAQSSLGKSLCNAKIQEDCNEWRNRVLVPWFKKGKLSIDVPSSFPSFQLLQWYNKPKILADTAVSNNPELQQNYMRMPRERNLLMVTSHRFNTLGTGYMTGWDQLCLLNTWWRLAHSHRIQHLTVSGSSDSVRRTTARRLTCSNARSSSRHLL